MHDIVQGPNDVDLHFFYKNEPKTIENWKKLEPMMVNVMDFFNKKHWELPVQTIFIYSRWRWGMEYAMSTLMLKRYT
jgi:hypothetical protein